MKGSHEGNHGNLGIFCHLLLHIPTKPLKSCIRIDANTCCVCVCERAYVNVCACTHECVIVHKNVEEGGMFFNSSV